MEARQIAVTTISLLLAEILRPAVRAVLRVPGAEVALTLLLDPVVDGAVVLVVPAAAVVTEIAVTLPNGDAGGVITATAITHPLAAGTVITGLPRHRVAGVTTTNLRRCGGETEITPLDPLPDAGR